MSKAPAPTRESIDDEDAAEPSPLLGPAASSAAESADRQALRSPHGTGMKGLFGWSMISPWCAIIGVGVSRDIYSLKYQADIGLLGTIQLVHGLMALLNDVAIGYLQDKEKWCVPTSCLLAQHCLLGPACQCQTAALTRHRVRCRLFGCFSKEKWGRRAPWLIVHYPIMALFMYFSWAPPSLKTNFLAVWYSICIGVCQWCWQQITIATQAGAAECYPFKEERMVVEAFNSGFSALGVMVAVAIIGMAYQYDLKESSSTRTLLGLICGGVGLISIFSAFAVKDARQVRLCTKNGGFLTRNEGF